MKFFNSRLIFQKYRHLFEALDSFKATKQVEKVRDWISALPAEAHPAVIPKAISILLHERNHASTSIAVSLLNRLLSAGVRPSVRVYSEFISSFLFLKNISGVKLVHNRFLLLGVPPDLVYITTYIDALFKLRDNTATKQYKIFLNSATLKFDLIFWNTVIDGMGKNKEFEEMVAAYEEMTSSGIFPDIITFTSIINAFLQADNIQLALYWFNVMQGKLSHNQHILKTPIMGEKYVYTSFIAAYSRSGDVQNAKKWFSSLCEIDPDTLLTPNKKTYTALLLAYTQTKNMPGAFKLLKTLPEFQFDTTVYNVLISGYAAMHDFEGCRFMMDEMRARDIKPSAATFSIIIRYHLIKFDYMGALDAFTEMLALDIPPTRQLIAQIIHKLVFSGRKENVSKGIQLYQKFWTNQKYSDIKATDRITEFHHALESLYVMYREKAEPRISVYDSMISYYNKCKGSLRKSATRVFYDCIKDGIRPDLSMIIKCMKTVGSGWQWDGIVSIYSDLFKKSSSGSAFKILDDICGNSLDTNVKSVDDLKIVINNDTSENKVFVVHDEFVAEVRKCTLAAYPIYALNNFWYGKKSKFSNEERENLTLFSYDMESRTFFLKNTLDSDTYLIEFWDSVMKMQMQYCNGKIPLMRTEGYKGRINFEAKSSKDFVEVLFTYFVYLFLRHCESNAYWDARSHAIEFLRKHGFGYVDNCYTHWLTQVEGYGRYWILHTPAY